MANQTSFDDNVSKPEFGRGAAGAPPCAYVVPNHCGWLVYTRQNSCRAQLRKVDGWTQEMAVTVARIIDGEVVL